VRRELPAVQDRRRDLLGERNGRKSVMARRPPRRARSDREQRAFRLTSWKFDSRLSREVASSTRAEHLCERGPAMEITEVRVFPVNEERLKAYVTITLDACFVARDP